MKNDKKESRKMTHFELGPASIGAVAKSEARDPFRARGVAAALAALYQHMRCVCFVACCFSVRLLTLSALSYCGCLAACAQSCPEKILSRIGATHASVRFSTSKLIQTLGKPQLVTVQIQSRFPFLKAGVKKCNRQTLRVRISFCLGGSHRIGATHASVRFSISKLIQTLGKPQLVTSGLLKCFAKVAPPRMD